MGKGHCMVVIQICDKCGSGICIVRQPLFFVVPNSLIETQAVKVSFTPLWNTLLCAIRITRAVKWWLLGDNMGNLAEYNICALWSSLPHLHTPPGSRNRFS